MANTETKPMSQIIHWSLFLACGATIVLKTLESASSGSAYIFASYPSVAQYSWLVTGLI